MSESEPPQEPPKEPPKTPPTKPGALRRRGGLPLSRPAIWAIVCGAIGLILTPLALAGIILGIVALSRLSKQKGQRQGHGLAIGGIVTGVIGLLLGAFYVFMVFNVITVAREVSAASDVARLSTVRARAVAYAELNDGYPEHVALLATNEQRSIQTLVLADRRDRRRNQVTVGGYDFRDYDGTYKADQAVIAAVAGADKTAPFYRFGDTSFVRLAGPTDDPGIVFCWRADPDTGDVMIVMDDGSTDHRTAEEWAEVRATDAAARAAAGLEAVVLPEVP